MTKKMIILADGKRIVTDRLTFAEHGNPVVTTYDLTKATHDEFISLQQNPNQVNLIDLIVKRK